MPDVQYVNRLRDHDKQKTIRPAIARPKKQFTDGLVE